MVNKLQTGAAILAALTAPVHLLLGGFSNPATPLAMGLLLAASAALAVTAIALRRTTN